MPLRDRRQYVDRLQTMRTFAAVAEHRGFAEAGRRIGLTRANVTRQVADLEAHLGLRLFERTTRSVRLTEAGCAYLPCCLDALAAVDRAGRTARSEGERVGGTVRVSAPIAYGRVVLPRAIERLSALHPDLALDIELSDRRVDLVHERFDMAVRIGEVPKSQTAHPLGQVRLRLVAAPSYLERRGAPEVPDDLAAHDCIAYTLTGDPTLWRLGLRSVRVSGPLRSNSGDLIVDAVRAGRGIALQPDFLVDADIAAGRLVALLADHRAPELAVSALVAPGPMTARVEAVLSALRKQDATFRR